MPTVNKASTTVPTRTIVPVTERKISKASRVVTNALAPVALFYHGHQKRHCFEPQLFVTHPNQPVKLTSSKQDHFFQTPSYHVVPVKPDASLASNQYEPSLEVIGAGLMRTGTTSLKRALELLRHNPCYHMSEVVYKHKQQHIPMWIEACKRKATTTMSETLLDDLCRLVFRGYTGAVDYPTCLFYKELMAKFPNAKVILTVKDPYEWIQSCRATTLSSQLIGQFSWGDHLHYWFRGLKGLPKLHQLMFAQTLGASFDQMTDEQLMKAYQHWNDQVIATVPRDRLLIFNVTEGWSPLCRFLGVPEPVGVREFPHLNKRAEMQKAVHSLYQKGRWVDRIIVLILCGLCSLFILIMVYHFHLPQIRS